jgi:hypothetical protein
MASGNQSVLDIRITALLDMDKVVAHVKDRAASDGKVLEDPTPDELESICDAVAEVVARYARNSLSKCEDVPGLEVCGSHGHLTPLPSRGDVQ